MPDPVPPSPPVPPPPPRAFTQGVGTVFQFAGVTLFLLSMFVCCSTGLLSPSTAVRPDLQKVGWGGGGGGATDPAYSVQRAMSIAMAVTVFYGIALASLGLGLQATHRRTPLAATALTGLAAAFYLVHAVFFATTVQWWSVAGVCGALAAGSVALLALSVSAVRELRANPPPRDFEVLPPDYNVPYSHLHQDPPEVRLQRELAQRRQRLAVQQKELQLLEEKLKRKKTRNNSEPPGD
jgi:hypothetical protein